MIVIAVVLPSCQTYAHCICPQLDRSFQKVGWSGFLVKNKKNKGLSTQQKVFINHCISTACFRIILLEHIQESDIRKKRQQQFSVMQMPVLRFSIEFKFKYKDSPFLSQVQFQRMTL